MSLSNPTRTTLKLIHDPLAINIRRQTELLLTQIPTSSTHYTLIRNASNSTELLNALSNALAAPALTKLVAYLYRPLLVDLCARWLHEGHQNYVDHLVALCYLVEVHEEVYPILHQLLLRHHEDGPFAFLTEPTPLETYDVVLLQRLLLAYYRIQQANRELPYQLIWPLDPLSKLIWEPGFHNGIRLLAIRCYSLQSKMGEAERIKVETEVLGEPCGIDCPLHYGQDLDGSNVEVDGWLMPVIEVKRIREERKEIASNVVDFYSCMDGESTIHLEESDLSPLIVNVHGVLLLRSSIVSATSSNLVATLSTTQVLQQLALQYSLRLPTLLTSTPSSGKALLISHLSSLLHPEKQNQVVTIHLADTSLDPRSLLGSYVSSTVHPGTFEWKEGVLVRAMQEGKWVVLKDVDRGSAEVLGVLKPLVESLELGKWIGGRARLTVPSRGIVVAHDEFRLFGTRSTAPAVDGTFHLPTFFGFHKFTEIVVPTPTPEELSTIVNAKFPQLAGHVAGALIRIWDAVRLLATPSAGREIGLRDLEKFCMRVQAVLPSHRSMDSSPEGRQVSIVDLFPHLEVREDIFVEAGDVFFGYGASTSTLQAHIVGLSDLIGEHLGLDADRRQWVLQKKPATFETEKNANGQVFAVEARRAHILARPTGVSLQTGSARPFAMHKPAIALMARIVTAVSHSEPLLLTGETGTGKTSVITHIASLLNQPLIALNLSHQTESSDLIGGLKPIDARVSGSAIQEKFVDLFGSTFSRRKNERYETEVRKAVNECKWKRVVGLWKESVRMAMERIQARQPQDDAAREPEEGTPRKRRKTGTDMQELGLKWAEFLREVEQFETQHVRGQGKFAFGFVEGPLVKALRLGHWVLLDEVNLASPETLECLSSLLQGPLASITLTEHGALEPVPRHPDFRIFACMNPATDVGKKDLPPTIRARFTEIDVPSPDTDKEALLTIINQYIGHVAIGDKAVIMDVAEFYLAVKQVAGQRQIADGANHRPHFSMRTLARALTFAADVAASFGLRRGVWEGCLMGFTMILDGESAELVTNIARKHLLSSVRNPQSMLAKEPSPPQGNFVKFGPFYLERGPLEEDLAEDYIITPSVAQKLVDLSRIILTRRFPILIEGPTSSGKTSSIEYLARRTGHQFVRINNHEHTDIQEYIGSYVSDPVTGKLVFRDGLLVQALRQGHWIVLDELNLAPTDVLEALNRLLDDNRELVIPETHEVVRPHPHFLLFATQNPPGLYGGRKVLSRAFRNRFLEVHFDDVPQAELETILCQRCRIAPSYGKKIVNVFRELQKRRQSGRVFESKQGFATLRDLFRWAGRDVVQNGYQELAENGFMLLAERVRRDEDKAAVKEVIEKEMGVRIDVNGIYDMHRADVDFGSFLGVPPILSSSVVWTKAMQRLYVLVSRALKFNEPVLLVGETGCGKTSVCQLFAEASSKRLVTLNCHQNTETADIIGGLRPIRNRTGLQAIAIKDAIDLLDAVGVPYQDANLDSLILALSATLKTTRLDAGVRSRLDEVHVQLSRLGTIFDWYDGPLVDAMRNGDVFLIDEISLADDSVLERLNSVLEPGRSIVLAEKGGTNGQNPSIKASPDFKMLATMNPGGDYGKKELSPALRNRFTEIWVPSITDREDLELILNNSWYSSDLQQYTEPVLNFIDWLSLRLQDHSVASLRDILSWIQFTNSVLKKEETREFPRNELFHHAAHMTFLDGLGSFPQLAGCSQNTVKAIKVEALKKLQDYVPLDDPLGTSVPSYDPSKFIQLGSFAIPRGPHDAVQQYFNFNAPTTLQNTMRVVRSCQVAKPILLEGSPGVGKTSLIAALATLSGHRLCRINLSDQTDLVDLFGSDLPVEGGSPGEFAWKDAEFLEALQKGHWVLLDEMNLAPQAVLEGLNAVLDHRGAVYLPELNRSYHCHPSFRIFAAQNPLFQGGGRKGLPKSFVNRFNKVYVDELTPPDLLLVCTQLFKTLDETTLRNMITFNLKLSEAVSSRRTFGMDGSPWEFNLRDVIRWATLANEHSLVLPAFDFLRTIYLHRFRNDQDRLHALQIYDASSSRDAARLGTRPAWVITPEYARFGCSSVRRNNHTPLLRPMRILKDRTAILESLSLCLSQSWLAIISGARDSGKTGLVRALAHSTGNRLLEVAINHATDTMDILGSFEQVTPRRRLSELLDQVIHQIELQQSSNQGCRTSGAQHHLIRRLRIQCDSPTYDTSELVHHALILLSTFDTPTDANDERMVAFASSIRELQHPVSTAGQFQWVNGPLVSAMLSGAWLLLDGANLCNPSVLDRLNSLCEPDGKLILSERGFVDGDVVTVKAHPDFRLFMTLDPHFGELSRAMRNRGVELFVPHIALKSDQDVLADHRRLPALADVATGPAFAATRRGLAQISCTQQVTPTGRCLDQDSVMSSMVDGLAFMIDTAVDQPNEAAWVHFFSRMLVPRVGPYLRRYLSPSQHQFKTNLHSFLEYFIDMQIGHSLEHLRQEFALREKMPSSFLSDLPLYFHWADSSSRSWTVSHSVAPSTAQSTVLNRLALAVDLFLSRSFFTDWTTKARDLSQKDAAIIKGASDLADSINELATANVTQDSHPNPDAVVLCSLLPSLFFVKQALDADTIDFSGLFAIAEWFRDTLSRAGASLSRPLELAKQLHILVSPSRGLGLFNLWAHVYPGQAAAAIPELVTWTDEAVSGLIRTPTLRQQAFRIICLETLPRSVMTEDQLSFDIGDLRERLNQCLNQDDLLLESRPQADAVVNLLGLELLSAPSSEKSPQRLALIMQEITTILKDTPTTSIVQAIPFQHLVWCDGNDTNLNFAFQYRAQVAWLENMWNTSQSNDIPGPSILYRPAMLQRSMNLSDMHNETASGIPQRKVSIIRHARTTLMMSHNKLGRFEQVLGVLLQMLRLVAMLYSDSFDTQSLTALQQLKRADRSKFSITILRAISLLQRSSLRHISQASESLRLFLESYQYRLPDEAFLSVAWIGVGVFLLDQIIPNIPIDPSSVHRATSYRQLQSVESLKSQIQLHERLEDILTGNSSTKLADILRTRLQEEQAKQIVSHDLPRRTDTPRLHTFWSEVEQFRKAVLEPTRLGSLVDELASGKDGIRDRELVAQESLAGFYRRLDAIYPEFADISILLKLGIGQIRLGLHLLAASPAPTCQLDPKVSFPLASHIAALIREFPTLEPRSGFVFSSILATLNAATCSFGWDEHDAQTISVIELANQQAIRLWLIDRAKEKQEAADASSLYRRNNTSFNAPTDAEIEAEELIALFPTFEDALQMSRSPSRPSSSSTTVLVQPTDATTMLQTHLDLVACSDKSNLGAHHRLYNLNLDTLRRVLLDSSIPSSSSLDQITTSTQLSILRNALTSLDSGSRPTSSYNFYNEANYPEAGRAAVIIQALRARLTIIASEWPDQMVLKHLMERCDIILETAADAPTAKFLTMIEQLLMQTDDWESYANRDNSIKSHREQLVGLIVRWRRLELACWQSLLDYQAKTFQDDDADCWFKLYDAVVRVPLSFCSDVTSSSELEEYLKTLIPLLNEFLNDSPLGRFATRLDVLQSFEHYTELISPSKTIPEQVVLRRIARVLHSIWSSNSIFAISLRDRYQSQKGMLEQEVQAFIKLASWKDVNIHALQQSARKSHHQLYKTVRKFRDLLNQPVRQRLSIGPAGDVETSLLSVAGDFAREGSDDDFANDGHIFISSPKVHLANLARTLTRFKSLSSTQVIPVIRRSRSQRVDELAVEVITTSRSLSRLEVPASLTGEQRGKYAKSLLTRKRKAWSDLLKELKLSGLTSNPRPETLRRHNDALWVAEQPVLANHGQVDTSRGEEYFIKVRTTLQRFRQSLPSHHNDLTTRELQRGQGFLESCFSLALELRSRLSSALDALRRLEDSRTRIVCLVEATTIHPFARPELASVVTTLGMARDSLSELRHHLTVLNELDVDIRVPEELLSDVTNVFDKTLSLHKRCCDILNIFDLSRCGSLTDSESKTITSAVNHIFEVVVTISGWREKYPAAGYLFDPLQSWLSAQVPSPFTPCSQSEVEDISPGEALVDKLLVCVQALARKAQMSDTTTMTEDSEAERYILDGYAESCKITGILNMDTIASLVDSILTNLPPWPAGKAYLASILPFLNTYIQISGEHVMNLNYSVKTLFKLDFVLCSLLQNLCEQGFCKPPEGEEEGGVGESIEASGVGIGEGEGTENVSKDIEDESQVEGLQEEDSQEQGETRFDKEDALEMDEDFGGALEDVSDEGEEGEEEDEEGGHSDFDEAVGDLDAKDPDVVDEKLWGDEKGPEDQSNEGKVDQDRSSKQESTSEVAARENEASNKQPQASKEPKPDDIEQEGADTIDQDEAIDEIDAGAPMDDHTHDADTLDLPDDMNLDAKEMQEKGDEEKGDDDEGSERGDQQDDLETGSTEDGSTRPDTIDQDEEDGTDSRDGAIAAEDETERAEDDTQHEEDGAGATAAPDVSEGNGAADSNQATAHQTDQPDNAGAAGHSQADNGADSTMDDIQPGDSTDAEAQNQSDPKESAQDGTSVGGSNAQQGPTQHEAIPTQSLPNPLRSLGDALKQIRQHFDEILQAQNQSSEENSDNPKPSQVEYLRPEDEDEDMQALGPAGDEQAAKLEQLNLIDDDMRVDEPVAPMEMDNPGMDDNVKRSLEDLDPEAEGTASTEGRGGGDSLTRQKDTLGEDAHDLGDGATHEGTLDNQVEAELRKWRLEDHPEGGAERLWRRYESLTNDLAYALCEQLRLILQPTLATRLKGDYRSGKRLNMKKVIAYIASDYTKDKIWLRRTKPSQREYQVLISIDDSRSMAESHSIHLAYQTLALISKALTKLESGDIAIAKFGQTVDLLRGFEDGPMAEHAGARMVDAFRFDQKATNVLSLIETSLHYLEAARERKAMGSSTASELWQLEIIISDGMCQDHDKIRRLLRKAEEQRVMLVFIILDSQHNHSSTLPSQDQSLSKHSILDMEKVDFKFVDGKMELVQQKYLDSFPFEYYVVLRNVETLPEVLSETLKQFFERISED